MILGTLNSGYILNQSEPLLAVATKDKSQKTYQNLHSFEIKEYNDFNVLLFRNLHHDEKRYVQWIDLIKSHYNLS